MNKAEVFITIKAEILFPEGMVLQDAMDELFATSQVILESTENVEVTTVEIESITDEIDDDDWTDEPDLDDEFYHSQYKGD